MSKKLAHTILFCGDLLCLFVFWIGYHDFKGVLLEVANQADIIRFNSRAGFYIVGLGLPLIHNLLIVDYLWPDFLRKYSRLANKSIIWLVIGLLTAGFAGSSWIKFRVKNAGYIYCRKASGISALARPLVYTRSNSICEELPRNKLRGG